MDRGRGGSTVTWVTRRLAMVDAIVCRQRRLTAWGGASRRGWVVTRVVEQRACGASVGKGFVEFCLSYQYFNRQD